MLSSSMIGGLISVGVGDYVVVGRFVDIMNSIDSPILALACGELSIRGIKAMVSSKKVLAKKVEEH